MGYQDEIMQIRNERAQRDQNEALSLIKERYQVAELERNRAASIGDEETFETWDRECEQLEDEWQTVAPPPPPQAPVLSEPTKAFLHRHQAFYQRYGDAANQATRAAHARAVQSGLKVDTEDYFKYCSDLLEMYAKDFNGARFDPSEKVPHANDVCHMLGLSYDQYNAQWRKMHAEGRNSAAQQQQQWSKKVG